MEKIISLAKRRGFIYQGSEIYGGLAGTWDYGPHGVTLKNQIKDIWWKKFISSRDDMYGIDAAILMNPKVWIASGHVGGFNDPLVEDLKTKKRYRADHLLEEAGVDVVGMSLQEMSIAIKEKGIKSPDKNDLGEVRQFNMMFKTDIGVSGGPDDISYLRPETAQGMFVNYKNVMDSFHPKLPFGLGQIGKAFRNEIAPRDFIFRNREMEQMEVEYFVHPDTWKEHFELWRKSVREFTQAIGLPDDMVHELEIPDGDRAHYSDRTIDFEFDFPFGRKELCGLAYRTDYDLRKHMEASKVNLEYFDEATKEKFIPHCIEPSLGVERMVLAVLSSAYTEDELGGETRSYLKLSPAIAPYQVAVFPLLKNRPELVLKAREVYDALRASGLRATFDDNGNVGKRYRRQDEIGTPFCVTIDFDTIGQGEAKAGQGEAKAEVEDKDGGKSEDGKNLINTVTIRNRDTGEQERVAIESIAKKIIA